MWITSSPASDNLVKCDCFDNPTDVNGVLQGGAGGRRLGLVDFDLGHSTTCLLVLGQMGFG